MSARYRAWCYTINNPTDDDSTFQIANNIRYHVRGREKGESGTPHLQGYIVYNNARALTAVKKDFPRAHLEPTKGTPSQAADYCKKDGDFDEHGTVPMDPKEKGDMEKERYQNAWNLAKEGNYEEIDADIRVRMYGTLKRIRQDYQVVPPSLEHMDFWWFYGSTGTGKSLTARNENPGYYIKNINKWWDGYVDQPCVIIEEWSPSVVPAIQQMFKTWCDHHPFAAETKGGTTTLRPPKIVVTSNYTLQECFGHDSGILEPLLRRIQVREF